MTECDMCGHLLHTHTADGDCEAVIGYDHINGDGFCGCPGPLQYQLAQAWDEGRFSEDDDYNPYYAEYVKELYRRASELDEWPVEQEQAAINRAGIIKGCVCTCLAPGMNYCEVHDE